MKKLILMGRVAAGKTTLTQALKGEQLHYCKTQYINYYDTIIDTPGEYTEVHALGAALAVYSYEADVVGTRIVRLAACSAIQRALDSICSLDCPVNARCLSGSMCLISIST